MRIGVLCSSSVEPHSVARGISCSGPPAPLSLPMGNRSPHTLHNVSDVTRLLDAVERGEPLAADRRHWAVYRATDTKLDREVAIKVLPESFAQDKERLARFEREAKLLASINSNAPFRASSGGCATESSFYSSQNLYGPSAGFSSSVVGIPTSASARALVRANMSPDPVGGERRMAIHYLYEAIRHAARKWIRFWQTSKEGGLCGRTGSCGSSNPRYPAGRHFRCAPAR